MNKKQQKNQRGTLTQRIPAKKINSPSVFRSSLHVLSWPCNNRLTHLPSRQRQCTGCDTAPYLVLPPAPRPHVPRTPAVLREEKSQPSAAQTTVLSPANSVRTCTGSLLGHGVQGLCGAAPPASSCWAGAGWAAPPWPSLQRSSSLISSN